MSYILPFVSSKRRSAIHGHAFVDGYGRRYLALIHKACSAHCTNMTEVGAMKDPRQVGSFGRWVGFTVWEVAYVVEDAGYPSRMEGWSTPSTSQ